MDYYQFMKIDEYERREKEEQRKREQFRALLR
jgi:hypothetical protein